MGQTARSPQPLGVADYGTIVVLTGAGISAGCGLPTFRGAGSTAMSAAAPEILSADRLDDGLDDIWQFCLELRRGVQATQPGPGHRTLAALAAARPGVTVITQNIDGLHQQAGGGIMVELHGSVWRVRCTDETCAAAAPVDDVRLDDAAARRRCPVCAARLRPDVVLYGERLDVQVGRRAKMALRHAQLFVAVGTSGVVWPASSFGRTAFDYGARCVLVNLEPHEHPPSWPEESYFGAADDLLPVLLS